MDEGTRATQTSIAHWNEGRSKKSGVSKMSEKSS
jgi:hypothetical protein